MSRIAKLFHRVINERYRPKFAEFQTMLIAAGFEPRKAGATSHRIYRHTAIGRSITIQPNGNMAQDYQVREFLAMVAEFELWAENE